MAQQGPRVIFALFVCAGLLDVLHSSSETECHQESPCLCRFGDDRVLNLSHLTGESFLQASRDNLTVYYHGCTDGKIPEILNIFKTDCDQYSTLYLYNKTDRKMYCMGDASGGKFRTAVDNPHMQAIEYKFNSTTTEVRLVCTPNYETSVLFFQGFNKSVLTLHLMSPHACPYTENTGLSTGSKLVIMLFTFGAIYLFGGACLSYCVRGARGREIVPNIDFWMGLPRLVRDGAIFVMNGCNPRAVPTDSYDQI